MAGGSDRFPTKTAGLPEAGAPEVVELADGAGFGLRIAPVAKRIGGSTVRMLAYNGTIPGPTLRVRQGSTLVIDAINDGDLEATVHWHGLRLDNRYDGTTLTQRPMPIGGRFSYRLAFPDPGVYWYHPHIREDYGQEMGLYGNIVVEPEDPAYWPPANRELALTVDDLLIEEGRIAPFDRATSNYTAMGRFGNVLLANGEHEPVLTARLGEVVRFYFTNTANTRVFRIALPGARMKLVGGDSGRCEQEQFVDSIVIAPSERAVVDVLFEQPGEQRLAHRTPNRNYTLALIRVSPGPVQPSFAEAFALLRRNADMTDERKRFARHFDSKPDKVLALVAEMDMGDAAGADAEYLCPMHPEVRSRQADRCPKCGMKLVSAHLVPQSAQPATHAGHGGDDGHAPHGGSGHSHDTGGIEWEDDMVELNRMTTPANTRWKLIDQVTGAHGAAIDWRFRVGDVVKIRLINEMDSDHPMHHPFHIHGAGRFLVLSRDGKTEPNLVWKDTVLVPTGQVTDILLEVTNPGLWMAHCHIAEHHESGMMLNFTVDP